MSRKDSSEQSQHSYIRRFNLIADSALEEAECFVSSLKALQASFNQTNSLPTLEKDLKETMDQYVRLTMVCDVLKVFNPFASPSPSPAPNTTTTSSSFPTIKEEAIDIKPAHLLRASPPLPSPQRTLPRNEVGPSSSAPSQPQPQPQPQVTAAANQNQPVVPNNLQVRPNKQQQAKPAPIANHSIQATPTASTTNNNNANINNNNNTHAVAAATPRYTPPVSSHSMPNLNTNNNLITDVNTQEGISTTKFIKTFEAILTYFANSNKLQVDDTWEKLFIHSLPPQQKSWFTTKIQGKHYTWEHAKNIFYQEFDQSANGDNNNNNNNNNKSQVDRAATEKADKAVARQTRYAEALLNLEMQDNDNIRQFNEKFKRYSEQAKMTCDSSLLKRYVNSLSTKYRTFALPLLTHPDYANNLDALMKHVERMEQPGLVEVDAPCSHNWSMGNAFKSTWSHHPQKRRASHGFENAEKRQRSQPVPQY